MTTRMRLIQVITTAMRRTIRRAAEAVSAMRVATKNLLVTMNHPLRQTALMNHHRIIALATAVTLLLLPMTSGETHLHRH